MYISAFEHCMKIQGSMYFHLTLRNVIRGSKPITHLKTQAIHSGVNNIVKYARGPTGLSNESTLI